MAVQGTTHDRVARLERQVVALRAQLEVLVRIANTGPGRWLALGTTSEAIASGATGRVALKKINDAGAEVAGHTVKAKNRYAQNIATGKTCFLCQDRSGKWFIITADC